MHTFCALTYIYIWKSPPDIFYLLVINRIRFINCLFYRTLIDHFHLPLSISAPLGKKCPKSPKCDSEVWPRRKRKDWKGVFLYTFCQQAEDQRLNLTDLIFKRAPNSRLACRGANIKARIRVATRIYVICIYTARMRDDFQNKLRLNWK